MATRRTKVALPVSPKAPSSLEKLLEWVQKEAHQLLIQMRDVINNMRDDLDGFEGDSYKVKTSAADAAPDYLQGKLGDTATVTWALNAGKMEATAIGEKPFDPHFFVPETLLSGATLAAFAIEVACSFPAGLTGSVGKAGGAATAEAVITIKKNGSSVGTITFAAAGTTATFAAASPITLAVGDLLQFVNQATADATLADVAIALKGVRT